MIKEKGQYIFTADQLSYLRESGATELVKEYIDKRKETLYNKIKSGQNATIDMFFETRGQMKELEELFLIFNIKKTTNK